MWGEGGGKREGEGGDFTGIWVGVFWGEWDRNLLAYRGRGSTYGALYIIAYMAFGRLRSWLCFALGELPNRDLKPW